MEQHEKITKIKKSIEYNIILSERYQNDCIYHLQSILYDLRDDKETRDGILEFLTMFYREPEMSDDFNPALELQSLVYNIRPRMLDRPSAIIDFVEDFFVFDFGWEYEKNHHGLWKIINPGTKEIGPMNPKELIKVSKENSTTRKDQFDFISRAMNKIK